MSGPYARPQRCPLCGAGPYGQPESLRNHTQSSHAFLGPRERSDVMTLADLASRSPVANSGHDLSLAYHAPQWCPKCERGPFTIPVSLWLHAYVWHGYLSVSELTDLMDTALWRSDRAR